MQKYKDYNIVSETEFLQQGLTVKRINKILHFYILMDTHIYNIYISILDSFLYNISLYTVEHLKKPLLNSKDETDSWLVTFWPKDGEREG